MDFGQFCYQNILTKYMAFSFLVLTLSAQNGTGWAGTDGSATAEAAVCPVVLEENLCIWPFDGVQMLLYDCATGSTGGFPPAHLNIPPGTFRFSILAPPESVFQQFAIVSEAVANGGGVDPCVGGPGVFVGPVPIQAHGTANPTIYEIPSAIIDQMIAQVTQDGFVVALAMGCPGPQLFSGLDFTRDAPADATDLSLDLQSQPGTVFIGDDFDIDIQIVNNGDESAENPVVSFPLPLGASFVSGILGGQPCSETGGMVSCPTNTLAPAASFDGSFTVSAGLGGKSSFNFSLESDICDSNSSDNHLTVAPLAIFPPGAEGAYALGKDGDGFRSEFWAFNASLDGTTSIIVSATDSNCNPTADPFGAPGFFMGDIPPGEGFLFATPGVTSNTNDILFWFQGELANVSIEVRVVKTMDGMDPVLLGTTQPAIPLAGVADFDDDYPIPFFDIVTGENQRVLATNLSSVPQATFGDLRDNTTGNMTTGFNTTLQPFQIKSFPLDALGLPGTNPHSVWKDSGNSVVMWLEHVESGTHQIIAPGPFDAEGRPLAVPVYRPDPDNMEYDPSDLDMFIYKQDGTSVQAGLATVSSGEVCGMDESATNNHLFPGNPPFTPILLPIDIDDTMGGFGTSPPETAASIRWREGNSQVLVKASTPATQGVARVPADQLNGMPGATPLDTKFAIRAEVDLKLPVATFDNEGNFLNFKFLDVPMGAHLYCLDDISLSDELDFLEFQVPPGQPGDVWFNAIADEPDLEYKDQLPIHTTSGETRVGNFTKVLDAWDGDSGTSCLGNKPDILDVVAFMNNGLKCP